MLCKRRTLSLLLALCAFGGGLVFYLPDKILRRLQSIGRMSDSSTHYRANTWRGVLRMLRAHPFGIGSGESAFRSVFPHYAVSGTETVMHAHQLLLEVAVEIGVVGLALFLLVLSFFFADVVRFCRKCGESARRAEAIALLASLAGALVMGLFDSLWYHNGLYWLFWSISALLLNALEGGFHEQNRLQK
jgi:O-antigen ligase